MIMYYNKLYKQNYSQMYKKLSIFFLKSNCKINLTTRLLTLSDFNKDTIYENIKKKSNQLK